jgi:putative transposase
VDKYRFILQHREQLPLVRLCRLLQLSRSAYYAWRAKKTVGKNTLKQELEYQIQECYSRVKGYAGYRIMTGLLRQQNIDVKQHQVRRLMKTLGLKGRHPQKSRPWRYEKVRKVAYPNVLERNFNSVMRPNAVWVGDITYLRIGTQWCYFAIVLDLFSRKVVGWALSDEMSTLLISEALMMAFHRRHKPRGILFHSDRGSQYLSNSYHELLQQYGIRQSMSRTGNCWDNAVAESFFKTLKSECANSTFFSIAQAQHLVEAYVEDYYNLSRPHSFNGYLSPNEKERLYFTGVL